MVKNSKPLPKTSSISPDDSTTQMVATSNRSLPPRSHRGDSLVPTTHPASQSNPRWWRTKRGKITLAIIGCVVIIAIGGTAYALTRKKPVQRVELPAVKSTPTESPVVKTTKPSALTGVEVEPTRADQPVVASIVENLAPNARPQSGLSSAGVVYEALSEGGITRYLALWQVDIPPDIGPVRSLRPVFYDMAMEYGAPVAHAGGSSDGLALARSGKGFKDLDQFYNGNWFRRISSRQSPHNLYIYGPKLVELATTKGWGAAPTFAPWTRKDDAKSATPNASVITINFSGADYRVVFRYDPATNSYLREVGGKADTDAAAGGKQINPKTVILLYASVAAGTQPNGKPKTDINVIGSGKGVVFQDGVATPVAWTKTSESSRLKLTDSNGTDVQLNRGQSWVSIAPANLPATWQ